MHPRREPLERVAMIRCVSVRTHVNPEQVRVGRRHASLDLDGSKEPASHARNHDHPQDVPPCARNAANMLPCDRPKGSRAASILTLGMIPGAVCAVRSAPLTFHHVVHGVRLGGASVGQSCAFHLVIIVDQLGVWIGLHANGHHKQRNRAR